MDSLPADLILHNARVFTPDGRPAELVAVEGNRILGVADGAGLEIFRGPHTRLIDCGGGMIVPGFNDAHCHPLAFAATLLHVDCSPPAVQDIAQLLAGLRRQAALTPAGRWVRAVNYDEFLLAERRPPTRWELDQACPNHPVIVTHRSGQQCVLNSLALQLAGIGKDTPDPPGGAIGRDLATGEPNGLISGRNPQVEAAAPRLDEEELERGVRLADQEYLSMGITSLQDTTWSNGLHAWRLYRRLVDRGSLAPRVCLLPGHESVDDFRKEGLATGSGDHRLRLGAMKLALDESSGVAHPPQEELDFQALRGRQAGFGIAFHVSDVHMLLASLSSIELLQQRFPGAGLRCRLEHCSVCPPGLLRRLAASRAMVVCQPAFLHYFGQRHLNDFPAAQQSWLYPIDAWRKQGMRVAASSDSPLVPCNPLVGIYAAATRRSETGQTVSGQNRVSAAEALRMYTLGGAQASFEEADKGEIAPGKLADLAVLSADPCQAAPEDIKDIRVTLTVIDGRAVWEG